MVCTLIVSITTLRQDIWALALRRAIRLAGCATSAVTFPNQPKDSAATGTHS